MNFFPVFIESSETYEDLSLTEIITKLNFSSENLSQKLKMIILLNAKIKKKSENCFC